MADRRKKDQRTRMRPLAERQQRLASQGSLVQLGKSDPKMSSQTAALWRKLGQYIDSADVEGEDTGLLDYDQAMQLRSHGVLVLDEEIEPPPLKSKL